MLDEICNVLDLKLNYLFQNLRDLLEVIFCDLKYNFLEIKIYGDIIVGYGKFKFIELIDNIIIEN